MRAGTPMSWSWGAKARVPSDDSGYCQSRYSCSNSGWPDGSTGPFNADDEADDDADYDSDVLPHCYTSASDYC